MSLSGYLPGHKHGSNIGKHNRVQYNISEYIQSGISSNIALLQTCTTEWSDQSLSAYKVSGEGGWW